MTQHCWLRAEKIAPYLDRPHSSLLQAEQRSSRMAAPATMTTTTLVERPDEVASKVMRRLQVSKMTRVLQDRLALANVKIQNGWENLSLDAIEPQVEQRLRRKRPASSNDTISDTASTTSTHLHSSNGLASSPLTEPMFSDNLPGSSRIKRIRPAEVSSRYPPSGAVTGRRTRSFRQPSWKRSHQLAESSPIKPTKHARFPSHNMSHISFVSSGSTIPDETPSPEFSEDDDADLPITSFSMTASTHITSSPPRTPPPDNRMRKSHNVSWSRTPRHGEEGVDLLMYLATSPSPAVGAGRAKTMIQPPSTPPHKATPLPSSHMTPGTSGHGFLGFGPTTPGNFGPHTPGASFNFADFVTLTPSPAQPSWNRTPNINRTSGTSARRKLNFEKSPVITRNNRSDGLGMELGGELFS